MKRSSSSSSSAQ